MAGKIKKSEINTLDILSNIQAGKLSPKKLIPEQRLPLVDFLTCEGHSIAEIAKILQRSDKTIERDRKAIFEQNAIEFEPKFPAQMTGKLIREAEMSTQKIRKIARDQNTPAAVKIDAYHKSYTIVSDLVQRMQGIGLMPSAAKKIEAKLTSQNNPDLSLDEILAETNRLKTVEVEVLKTGQEGKDNDK